MLEIVPCISVLYDQGMTESQIAEKLHISKEIVRFRIHNYKHGISPVGKGANDRNRSICADCKVCTCSWMENGKPVKGWKATRSKLYSSGWRVFECPKFIRSEKRKDMDELTKEQSERFLKKVQRELRR